MEVDVNEFFDKETLAALRSLRRDRKLTIGAGGRPWVGGADDADAELPCFVCCMDLDAGRILSGSTAPSEDQDQALVAMLIKAMLEPEKPAPARLPRRVIVEEQAIARAIEPPLGRLGVQVVVEPMPALDQFVEAMRVAATQIPLWFRDTAAGLPLHQAAAALWAADPWDLLPDEDMSATVEIGEPVNRRLHAMAVDGDELAAVMFLLSDEDFERMTEESENDEGVERPGAAVVLDDGDSMSSYDMVMVMYVDVDDADQDEIDHVEQHRWPIGSGSAYPRFARAGDGDVRQVNDEEAHLLTLAMDALAAFCLAEQERLEDVDIPVWREVMVRDGDSLVEVSVVAPAETGL